jgi:hypothetical protein
VGVRVRGSRFEVRGSGLVRFLELEINTLRVCEIGTAPDTNRLGTVST